ncbi:MAG: histidinol-phosphate transaminase [Verrucomicrobiota bacterium JB022]|nr:histidinol-phosphate transaminase [Verrucomicrobiota bacterium JB022]
MSYTALLQPQIQRLPVYQPGRPIELVAREFGLQPEAVIKLASNENPLGASPRALDAARASLKDAWLYPENSAYFLCRDLGERLGLPVESFTIGAGSNEIFYLLASLFLGQGSEAVMGEQAFVSYLISTVRAGAKAVRVPMPNYTHDLGAMLAAVTERTRLVYLPNPNNPTGTLLSEAEVLEFARALPDHVIFVYDEAYAEYQETPPDLRPLIREGRKVICTRTFSKIYGLAGLRVGYGYSDPELAALINSVRPPFNTSNIAQVAARAALADAEWVERSRTVNTAGLRQLEQGLQELGLETVPSAANFILAQVPKASEVDKTLQSQGIIVRPVAGYDLPHHLRISVGTEPQNARLLKTLGEIINR